MRILKTVILCLAFVVAVFLCSANVHTVALHYVPDIGVPQLGEPRSLQAPLFLLVLASVAIGLVLGGGGALFEQARLRLELRQAKKAAGRYHEQAIAADSDLSVEREEVARLKAEVTNLKRECDALRAPAPPADDDFGGDEEAADSETEERDFSGPADSPDEAAPSDEEAGPDTEKT